MIGNYEKQHYLWQRKVIGFLIFFLPIAPILMTFLDPSNPPQSRYSISATYFTNANIILIGVASICGFFMLTYRPYKAIVDTIANWLSGIGLIGMIVFPTNPLRSGLSPVNIFMVDPTKTNLFHCIFTVLIFIGFFINLVYCFQKTAGEMTEKKKARNRAYKIVAWIYLLAALIVIFRVITGLAWLMIVAEIIAIIPTSIAWLVKAEFFSSLND